MSFAEIASAARARNMPKSEIVRERLTRKAAAAKRAKGSLWSRMEDLVIHSDSLPADLRDTLEQLLQQRARKQLISFRQHAGELRVVALDRAHRIVQLRSDVRSFRKRQQEVKTRIRREKENSLGVVSRRIFKARTTPASSRLFFERCSLLRESHFNKAQENQPKNWPGVLLRVEP